MTIHAQDDAHNRNHTLSEHDLGSIHRDMALLTAKLVSPLPTETIEQLAHIDDKAEDRTACRQGHEDGQADAS